jgi:hypothetical protein
MSETSPKDLLICKRQSAYQLWRMEVIRPKMPVERDRWVNQVEAEVSAHGKTVQWLPALEWLEAETGFWRLQMFWKESSDGTNETVAV